MCKNWGKVLDTQCLVLIKTDVFPAPQNSHSCVGRL